jgi:type I restriction enzyme S subunit
MKVQEMRADYSVRTSARYGAESRETLTTARLGDVTESMKNGLYKPASEYGDDGVPCLRMYNIDAGQIVWRDIKRMRVSASELEDYGLIDGDLLVNRVNSRELVGKTALIPPGIGPSVFESKNIRLRLKTDQALPKFINYQLLAFGRQHFSNNAQQVVGMASVSQKQLADFPIVLAPLAQQKRIVAEIEKQFSRLDEAVANLKRVKANLKRYKAAVLKAAVEGRLVETEAERARREGRSYETGAQLLQRILETRRSQWQGKGKYKEPVAPDTTDLPELPEGWVWTTVGQLGVIKGGKRLPAGHVYAEEKTPYPYIRVTDFENYGVRTSELQYLKEETQKEIARYTISSDDIYISIAGSIGLVGQVPEQLSGANLTENAAKITGLEHVVPMYLVYWLSSSRGISHISDSTIATTQAKLALFRIEQIPVPLPSLSEQHRIVAEVDRRLSLLRETEAQVEANLQRAERLRQSILSRAFSGFAS